MCGPWGALAVPPAGGRRLAADGRAGGRGRRRADALSGRAGAGAVSERAGERTGRQAWLTGGPGAGGG
ncbi:MAG: hypothetical protein ACK587_17465 [Cyanobacteriota bacterium]